MTIPATHIQNLRVSLSETARMVKCCVAQVQKSLDDSGEDAAMRTALLGKDSIVSALAKLLAMQKQVIELMAQVEAMGAEARRDKAAHDNGEWFKPMADADWELLERSVARWRASQDASTAPPPDEPAASA